MAQNRFEEYRQHFSRMHPNTRFIEDGAVVLEAANWHAFQDPETKLALEKADVEALGISATNSNREIIVRLREVLSKEVLPQMYPWTSRYLQATRSTEPVENLEEWKCNAAVGARAAIGEILKFCEEEEGVASNEDLTEPPSILKKLLRLSRRLFRK